MAKKKNAAAQKMARLRAKKLGPERVSEISGIAGKAAAEKLTPAQRKKRAKDAANARWDAKKAKPPRPS